MKREIRISFVVLLSAILLIQCNNQPKRIQKIKNNLAGYIIHTENGDCEVVSDFVDPLTGVRKTDLKPLQVFTYTHPRLKDYFTDAPFLVCNAQVSLLDQKDFALELEFVFSAKNVQASYNGLSEESMLRISLINGENLFLNNIIDDSGTTDKYNRKIYRGLYKLSKSDIKLLRKFEINSFGVIWNGGFETYDVHEIDFLRTQLECLDSI